MPTNAPRGKTKVMSGTWIVIVPEFRDLGQKRLEGILIDMDVTARSGMKFVISDDVGSGGPDEVPLENARR